jgi:TolB-like protein/Flp pilus assembly protein TadD
MALLVELRRRNVFKVGAVYVIVAWLIAQMADVLAPALNLPSWTTRFVAFLIVLGFPLALVLAWAYELTPEGIKRTKSVPLAESIRQVTGQKLNYAAIGLLALAVAFLVVDNYVLEDGFRGLVARAPAESADAPAPLAPSTAADAADAELASIRSIAVLPLANLSSDQEQEYFSDGMTDALIGQLAGIRSLRVISRQSIMRYKNSATPMPQIATELDVDAVIEGTVLKSANGVRISIQLIHAPTDRHLWAAEYSQPLDDVLAMQAEIAKTVAQEIRATVTAQETERLTQTDSVDPEAYDLYLRGRYFWAQRSPDALRRSIEYFERVIEIEPEFAPAYAGLAEAYGPLGYQGSMPPEEATPRMKAAATRALELEPDLVEGLTALAACVALHEWDWAEGERLFQRAIDVNPNYSTAFAWYGQLLLVKNRPAEALPIRRRAYELDPLWVGTASAYAEALAVNGRIDEALALMQKTLELHPGNPVAIGYLGWIYVIADRFEDAVETWTPLGQFGGLGHAYAVTGRRAEAQAVLAALQERARTQFVSPSELALIHVGLGDADAALDELERGAALRFPGVNGIMVDRRFAPLASEPRFLAVAEKIGLR